MSYHALYRQYRPSRFCEVVGQEHITDVLRNQIRTGALPTLIFSAVHAERAKQARQRILARAVNCLEPEGRANPAANALPALRTFRKA